MFSIKRKIDIIYCFFQSGLKSRLFKSCGDKVYLSKDITLFGEEFISIGNNVSLGSNSTLTAWGEYKGLQFKPQIIISDNVIIGEGFHITAINKIVLGKGLLTGKYITISDNSHGNITIDELSIIPSDRILVSKGPVIIEENVWIGDKVTILPNVRIGKNSIIGANSVVTKDIPPNTVVGGNPAKIIKNINEGK